MVLDKRFFSAKSLWSMRVDHPYSMMVRQGDLAWSCGQCPLDSAGDVIAPLDIVAQARVIANYLRISLRGVEMPINAVRKLVMYHSVESGWRVREAIDEITAGLGNSVSITPICLGDMYYRGMMLEVDAWAYAGKAETWTFENELGASGTVVESDELIWVSLEVNESRLSNGRTDTLMEELTAQIESKALAPVQVVFDQWFTKGTASRAVLDAADLAGICGDLAGTVELARSGTNDIVGELIFVKCSAKKKRSTKQTFDIDNTYMVFRQVGSFFSLSAREITGRPSLAEQARVIMRSLEDGLGIFDHSFSDVVKSTTYYKGGGNSEELHRNMIIRNGYYASPGPASTGLPVKGFPFSDSQMSVSLFGVGQEA